MFILNTGSIFKFINTIYTKKYAEWDIHKVIKKQAPKVLIFIKIISFEFHFTQMMSIMHFSWAIIKAQDTKDGILL